MPMKSIVVIEVVVPLSLYLCAELQTLALMESHKLRRKECKLWHSSAHSNGDGCGGGGCSVKVMAERVFYFK